MAFLDLKGEGITGNTFTMYLSDYGKSVLANGFLGNLNFFNSINKFGLSDKGMDYRRFSTDFSGNCVNQIGFSALTGSCFYDIVNDRGGVPLSSTTATTVDFGCTQSILKGPRVQIINNTVILTDTDQGTAPDDSTLWHTFSYQGDSSPMMSNCWKVGGNITPFLPTYCMACADFNKDNVVDKEDLATFLQSWGGQAFNENELIGDFNGDGVVNNEDLDAFLKCWEVMGPDTTPNPCSDVDSFCMMYYYLGMNSPCKGNKSVCDGTTQNISEPKANNFGSSFT